MKRGGIWLITMAVASFFLPLLGIRLAWIEMFGGSRAVAAILVIIAGVVLYAIGDAREQASRSASSKGGQN